MKEPEVMSTDTTPRNLQDLATKTAYKHQSCDNLCWFPPCTNPTRLHSQAWQDVAASKSHLKKKKRPEVSSVSQKVNPGPSPSLLTVTGFPLFHGRGEQAWLVGLAWRQAVYEQKEKFPATEMLPDITASISIILLS